MDQRTRERLPVLPVLTRTAAERKNTTARHFQAAMATPPGELIEDTDRALRQRLVAAAAAVIALGGAGAVSYAIANHPAPYRTRGFRARTSRSRRSSRFQTPACRARRRPGAGR